MTVPPAADPEAPEGPPPEASPGASGDAPARRSRRPGRRHLLALGIGLSVAVVALDKALLDGALFDGAGWSAFVWGLCVLGLGIGLYARFGARLRARFANRPGRDPS